MELNKYIDASEANLSNCDREPIHLLGRIQSSGELIAVDKNKNVVYVSETISELFNKGITEVLNSKISELISTEAVNSLSLFEKRNINYETHYRLETINDNLYQLFFAQSEDLLLIEFERIDSLDEYQQNATQNLSFISSLIKNYESAESINILANNTAIMIKEYTGYDRVMVYKFAPNGDGEVIAEEKAQGLESFLGLRYPATDIPRQARALYVQNKIRTIEDVSDIGKGIVGIEASLAENKLDLSFATFRTSSPIHIQYLKNMGVTATHAISVIDDGNLWGMIICHNYSGPFSLSINKRLNTQIVGDIFTNRLKILESKLEVSENLKLSRLEQKIKSFKGDSGKLLDYIADDIKEIFDIDDIYFEDKKNVFGSKVTLGFNPSSIEKGDIGKSVFYSHKIKDDYLIDSEYAGLLAIDLGKSRNGIFYLLRREITKKINWAGQPSKAVSFDKNDPNNLLPRNSFAIWKEKIDGQSEEWSQSDIRKANKLKEILLAYEIEHLRSNSDSLNIGENEKVYLERIKELDAAKLKLQSDLENKEELTRGLEEARIALENIKRIKSDFLANMSHEIRTPLNGIMGIAYLIKENPDSTAELEEYADMQLTSVERMLNTVNRILQLARIEATAYKSEFEKIDIGVFLTEILKPLRVLAEKKNQSIEFSIHQKDNIMNTDKFLIDQIFTNIVSNAIKYTNDNGKIDITLKKHSNEIGQFMKLIVEDNGIGISDENKDKVFESFFMEKNSLNHKDDSTGLGLYLVKNYSNYLNASININSQKGKGTIFEIDFPINVYEDEVL